VIEHANYASRGSAQPSDENCILAHIDGRLDVGGVLVDGQRGAHQIEGSRFLPLEESDLFNSLSERSVSVTVFAAISAAFLAYYEGKPIVIEFGHLGLRLAEAIDRIP